jgi:hypothetical protein
LNTALPAAAALASKLAGGGGNRQLVVLQRRQLAGRQIGIVAHLGETGTRGHRKPYRVVEAGIDEGALPVHFEVGDEGVPVGDAAPARVGVQVDAGEPERGR